MLVVHGFPPAGTGGTEIYTRDLALELRARFGDEVSVLAREADPSRPDLSVRRRQLDGVTVALINNTLSGCRTFEQTYRHRGVRRVAAGLLDELRPEVLHFHHLTCLSTELVLEAACRELPTIFTLHDFWLLCQRGQLLDLDLRRCPGPLPARCARCVGPAAGSSPATYLGAGLLRSLEQHLPGPGSLALSAARRLARTLTSLEASALQMARRTEHIRDICARVSCFLAPSRALRDRFVAFGIPAGRILHAELGIDHQRLAGPGGDRDPGRDRRGEPLRFGFLGSLIPSKGPHLLLEAFAGLPRGSARLHVFGDHASYHGDHSFKARLLPLLALDDVTFHGPVAHDRIRAALDSMDLLVVPSIWEENAPLVVQEAFVAGIPVVASALGGLNEVVDHGRGGLLFPPGDVAALRRALLSLIEEPDLPARLRSSVPPVRSLSADARFLRELYEQQLSVAPCRSFYITAAEPSPAMDGPHRRLAAVVLNWGTAAQAVTAVQALQASRRPVDDLLVVDNGSPDGSEKVLRQTLTGVSVLQTGANLGFSGGCNAGIRLALARGADAVMLVNSDVTLDPDCLGRLEQVLYARPDRGIVGPLVLARSEPDMVASQGILFSSVTGRMHHLGFGQRMSQVPGSGVDLRVVDGVSGCAMLIRKEVIEQVGMLDEDYFFSFEDLDLCLRAARGGLHTVCVLSATALHEGGQSIGKRSWRRLYFATRNHLLLARRLFSGSPLPLALMRGGIIVCLNVAHALLTADTPRAEGLGAMALGLWHHLCGRYGEGP